MPFHRQIIKKINDYIVKNAINDSRFANAKIVDIAKTVYRDTESFPVAVSDLNEYSDISIDDTYSLIIYHRVGANSYTKSKTNDANIGCKTDVKMVVYGSYSALNLSEFDVEGAIAMNFPSQISSNGLAVDNIIVNITGSDMDSLKVFNEEYKVINFRLAENGFLFSIKYTIETQFKSGCFNICNC